MNVLSILREGVVALEERAFILVADWLCFVVVVVVVVVVAVVVVVVVVD